jgi:hypothetical protein
MPAQGVRFESLYRLIFKPEAKRVYPSFPMTHVMDMPDTQAEIDAFRAAIAEHFITFDPGDMDEKRLLSYAEAALEKGQARFAVNVHGRDLEFDTAEVGRVARDIDAQIYARDFKLIDQSDMIVSFIPELPGGVRGVWVGVLTPAGEAPAATSRGAICAARARPPGGPRAPAQSAVAAPALFGSTRPPRRSALA